MILRTLKDNEGASELKYGIDLARLELLTGFAPCGASESKYTRVSTQEQVCSVFFACGGGEGSRKEHSDGIARMGGET